MGVPYLLLVLEQLLTNLPEFLEGSLDRWVRWVKLGMLVMIALKVLMECLWDFRVFSLLYLTRQMLVQEMRYTLRKL